MVSYKKRLAEEKVLNLSKVFPVVLVTGARQCGKTTMLMHLADKNREYVSLDDMNERLLADRDPELFFQKHKTPIFIDEIQYAPSIFSFIKKIVDKNKMAGEFWISGSQDFAIMKNVSESLAGRMGIVKMHPMIYEEIDENYKEFPQDFSFNSLQKYRSNNLDIKKVFAHIFGGGMPGVIDFDDGTRADYFDSYLNTYLMKDAVEFGKITDYIKFRLFISAVASQNTHQVNYANLASVSGISEPTAKEWLSILQALGLIWILRPYYNNTLKRLVKTPKIYFYDTGLCAHILRIPNAEVLSLSSFSGEYFENFVLNLFKVKLDLNSTAPSMFYYRDVDKNEIDLVLEDFQGLHPFEIKLAANPDKNIIKRFDTLLSKIQKPAPGGIVCLSSTLTPLSEKYSVIPAGLI